MKLSIAIIAAFVSSAYGFSSISTTSKTFSRGLVNNSERPFSGSVLFSEPQDDEEEEEGLDLDLGEMFEM